ncbi:succinyl-CoA--3-ketoacid-CoA transferase [Prauserella muralis]|uniref:Succinyl-CoA--3-ketoacid-CoA transferase n=1 Tax=Prauserella muralis TaxID=588067 RepID=A0A2V4AQJ5_9PSEU|nr:succinyl-CoA--3-ketoacid-CoA transferase [Prauserella muralis]
MRLDRPQIAARVARDLQPGWYVNLGVGIPLLLANALARSEDFALHSENGILGLGPEPSEDACDPDLVDAGGRHTSVAEGASFFDSALSFAMLRGGHINASVIGAYQVSATGDVANWNVPGRRFGGIGGAADIGASVPNLFVTMTHTSRDGEPKIVRECTYPLTAVRAASRIYTDLAVITVTPEGLRLDEVVDGLTPQDVQAVTDAPLHWDDTVRTLTV